jgi:hypothetical protein
MSVFKIAVSTILAGLIAAGGPALAARTPANALQPVVRESSRDIAAFEHANVPLVHAIDRAEQRGGGQPVAVAFDADHGNPVYAIVIVKNGVIRPVVIRTMSPHANSSPVRSGIRLNQR